MPRGVGVSTTSRVRPNRSVATMLVVRAPMWMPSVRNGSWFTSTGTRGRPIAPDTARSARSRSTPASSRAVTWRLTVAMLRPVTWAMTSRAIGPRSRAAPKTDAAAAVRDAQRGGHDVVAGPGIPTLAGDRARLVCAAGACRTAVAVVDVAEECWGGGGGAHGGVLWKSSAGGVRATPATHLGRRRPRFSQARRKARQQQHARRTAIAGSLTSGHMENLARQLKFGNDGSSNPLNGSQWSPAPARESVRRPRKPLPDLAFTWSAWPAARTASTPLPTRSAAPRLWRTSLTQAAVDALAASLDRVDVLVNNAGGAKGTRARRRRRPRALAMDVGDQRAGHPARDAGPAAQTDRLR